MKNPPRFFAGSEAGYRVWVIDIPQSGKRSV